MRELQTSHFDLSGEFGVPTPDDYERHEYFLHHTKARILEKVVPNRRLDAVRYREQPARLYFDPTERSLAVVIGNESVGLVPITVHVNLHPQTHDIMLSAVPLEGMPPSWRESFLLQDIMTNVYDSAVMVAMYQTARSN